MTPKPSIDFRRSTAPAAEFGSRTTVDCLYASNTGACQCLNHRARLCGIGRHAGPVAQVEFGPTIKCTSGMPSGHSERRPTTIHTRANRFTCGGSLCEFESHGQEIADRPNGGYPCVQQRTSHTRAQRLIFGLYVGERLLHVRSHHRAEMHVKVDEARNNRSSGYIEDFRIGRHFQSLPDGSDDARLNQYVSNSWPPSAS